MTAAVVDPSRPSRRRPSCEAPPAGPVAGFSRDTSGPGDASYFAANTVSPTQKFAVTTYVTCEKGTELSLSFGTDTSKDSSTPITQQEARTLAALLVANDADLANTGSLIVSD
jgi:hypothetical protein